MTNRHRAVAGLLTYDNASNAQAGTTDDSATIREIVSKVCTHAGVALEDVTESVAARTGNDAAYTIDSTKARERFGWRPRVTLDEGISEVVDWVGRDWETIRTLPLEYVHKP